MLEKKVGCLKKELFETLYYEKMLTEQLGNLVRRVCTWEGESKEVSSEVTQLLLLQTDVAAKKYLLPPVCR